MNYRKFNKESESKGIDLYDKLIEQYDNDTLEVLTYMLFNDHVTTAFTEPLYEPLREMVQTYDQCETVINAIRRLKDVE